MNGVRAVKKTIEGEIVAIDGKTVRGVLTRGAGESHPSGYRMGGDEQDDICPGENRGEAQRDHVDTGIIGKDSAGRVCGNDRRDGLPVCNR